MKLLIKEVSVNKDEDYCIGDSGVYETYFEKIIDLFRMCMKKYGRCTGYIYIDKGGKRRRIGWLFEKTDYYEDTKEPYKKETWVTVHEKMPKTTVEYFHHEL